MGPLRQTCEKSTPKTKIELKRAIASGINEINNNLLVDVINNFDRRLGLCIDQNGGHFVDL